MSNEKTKISFWERFSYGCGDLGCNIIYSAMSSFLLFYYTDYVHVNAATIGTIMLLSRIFDGVTDLIMGMIVDRTKSRFGKCRPWILRMAIPFALAGILLFSVPSGLGNTSKLIYIFITYNLVSSVVYTAINVPYATLNSLITQNQYERSRSADRDVHFAHRQRGNILLYVRDSFRHDRVRRVEDRLPHRGSYQLRLQLRL